jgi:hypothetical protein
MNKLFEFSMTMLLTKADKLLSDILSFSISVNWLKNLKTIFLI